MLSKVLRKTGEPINSRMMMYKAVFQAVLLYRRKIWVVAGMMMAVFEGFHHRLSRRISGMVERRGDGGEWEWDPVDTELEVTGLCLMREYVQRWQSAIVEYVVGRPIYELCKGVDRMGGSRKFLQW